MPKDKVKHFILMILCYIGGELIFKQGILVAGLLAITIELVQAEAGVEFENLKFIKRDLKVFLGKLFSKDSLFDLVADSAGIVTGWAILKITCFLN